MANYKNKLDCDSSKGTYALILKANKKFQCQVGRLGLLQGKAGHYVYVGSAFGSGGIAARVKHHVAIAGKPHWHLDYVRPYLLPIEVWTSDSLQRLEHQWAEQFWKLDDAIIPLKGFGASDCKCLSHLFYFTEAPLFSAFCNRQQVVELRRTVLL